MITKPIISTTFLQIENFSSFFFTLYKIFNFHLFSLTLNNPNIWIMKLQLVKWYEMFCIPAWTTQSKWLTQQQGHKTAQLRPLNHHCEWTEFMWNWTNNSVRKQLVYELFYRANKLSKSWLNQRLLPPKAEKMYHWTNTHVILCFLSYINKIRVITFCHPNYVRFYT